ncbi:NAD(P)/FAD-dependent oxidoreductase [Streptomyces sedi]|uniref:FAD-binding domain-containing protein n=1 Tax=Streptomyces sedi TaxID=555059 RepID=A0A5C4V4L5_9ACTN|nr:FAD-dependent monooxygenase [Streptomyces sedi]TNM30595.1 hypothetical protein FH715_11365 [Streptomyces sedi]
MAGSVDPSPPGGRAEPRRSDERCDVAVLGTGLPACVLAAILAARGADVVLVGTDDEPEPSARGAVTVPYLSLLLRQLAVRYRVPGLTGVAGFAALREHAGPSAGVARSLGFVYHRAGRGPSPREVDQLATPNAAPAEAILHRPETDAYLLRLALASGAGLRRHPSVAEVATGPGGVELTTSDGATLRCRYVVDAVGRDSPLARAFGLREGAPAPRHASRAIHGQLVGVRPFDEVVPGAEFKPPVPWHAGPLHHVCAEGVLTVTPFGNHRKARNPLTGVELTLDAGAPPSGAGPEEEFRAVVERYPGIAAHLRGARRAGPLTATPGPQGYRSARMLGDRWCLLGDSAGHVDPFLAQPLVVALEVVGALAWRLLAALRDDDFSPGRFAAVGEVGQALLDSNEALVAQVAAARGEYLLWKAVLRVWETGLLYGTFQMLTALGELRRTGSDEALRNREERSFAGYPFPGHRGYRLLQDRTSAVLDAVAAGTADGARAGLGLLDDLAATGIAPPPFGLTDPAERFYYPRPPVIAKVVRWTYRGAPPGVGPLVRAGLRNLVLQRLTR